MPAAKSGAPAVALPKYCQLCAEAGPAATRTAVVAVSAAVPDKFCSAENETDVRGGTFGHPMTHTSSANAIADAARDCSA